MNATKNKSVYVEIRRLKLEMVGNYASYCLTFLIPRIFYVI